MVETTGGIAVQRTKSIISGMYRLEQEQEVKIRLRTGCDFLMARANFTVLSDRSTLNVKSTLSRGEDFVL